jgi:(2Fe-2S) ferredoxin/SAM-dependent methyltransferase
VKEETVSQSFSHHVLICTQNKPDGIPSCLHVGGKKIAELFRREISKLKLADDVLVTGCECLGLCERGPNIVIYPEGRWYTAVKPEEVSRIVQEHLQNMQPLTERADPDEITIRKEVNVHRKKVLSMVTTKMKLGVMPDEFNLMVRGFMSSRIVLSAIELDLFTAVGSGATAKEVADLVSADSSAMERLLNALVGLQLLSKQNHHFYNSDMSDTFLRKGSPHDSRTALHHSIHLWSRWSTLTDCIKKGTSVTVKEIKEQDDSWTKAFIAAMHKIAVFSAPKVISHLDLDKVRSVLDLGGGSGAYALEFARQKRDINVTVFDLPNVTPFTKQYTRKTPLKDRITIIEGDMHYDDYGTNFDLVFISAICHMLSPKGNQNMLQRAKKALSPGGRIVIQDFILNDDKTDPPTAAIFALNMLVGTQKGSSYSAAEYRQWLKDTGFITIKEIKLPGPTDLITAKKRLPNE